MAYNGSNSNNRFAEYFIRLGAIDEEHSIPLDEVKFRKVILFRRMIAGGIFVPCKSNRIYIDLKALECNSNSANTKERLFLAIAILLIIILLTILLSVIGR